DFDLPRDFVRQSSAVLKELLLDPSEVRQVLRRANAALNFVQFGYIRRHAGIGGIIAALFVGNAFRCVWATLREAAVITALTCVQLAGGFFIHLSHSPTVRGMNFAHRRIMACVEFLVAWQDFWCVRLNSGKQLG